MCITVSRHTTCCLDGQPCATKCEQCEKDGKAYIERVLGSERDFEHLTKGEDMVVLKMATRFFASLAAAPLFHTHQSHCGLHRVAAAFWLSVFASVFAPVFPALSYLLLSQFSAILTSRAKALSNYSSMCVVDTSIMAASLNGGGTVLKEPFHEPVCNCSKLM